MGQSDKISEGGGAVLATDANQKNDETTKNSAAVDNAVWKRLIDALPLPVIRGHLPIRWLMLTLLCGALIGSYYCYDNPAALENQLEAWYNATHNDTGSKQQFSFKYNLLYSVYSYPNIILPFFGGYFSDKLGVRLMAVICTSLISLGQLIFAIGLSLSNHTAAWGVMYFGRTVFGLGGETLSVAMSAMIAQWFTGKELALALGMNLALARVGSVINDQTSQAVADAAPIYWALWVGLLVCILSLLATIWAFYIDVSAVKKLRKNRTLLIWRGQWPPKTPEDALSADVESGSTLLDANLRSPLLSSAEAPNGVGTINNVNSDTNSELVYESPKLSLAQGASDGPMRRPRRAQDGQVDALSLPPARSGVPSSSVKAGEGYEYSPAMNLNPVAKTLENDQHSLVPKHNRTDSNTDSVSTADIIIDEYDDLEVNPEQEEINLMAATKFPLTFWLLTGSCLTVYCTVLPFNNIAAGFIKHKWHKTDHEANTIMMITYLVAGLLSPFMGWVIDRIGMRAVLNVIAAGLIVGVHAVLGFTYIQPYYPLAMLGLCYSIYAAALWPSIALVIEPELQGTAYGVVTAVQNAGLAFVPMIVGTLSTYAQKETLFIGLGVAGVVCGLVLNFVDFIQPVSILNLSEASANKCAEELKIQDQANRPLLGALQKENSSLLQSGNGRQSFGAVDARFK